MGDRSMMKLPQLSTTLVELVPNAVWRIEGDDLNDYDNIIWLDENITKPSKEECDTLLSIRTNEYHLYKLREKRNTLLLESDWTQFRDVSLPNDVEWATYRQALRDLPANTTDPENPTWPTKPS